MKNYNYKQTIELQKEHEHFFLQKKLYLDNFKVENRLVLKGGFFIYSFTEKTGQKFKIAQYSEEEEYVYDIDMEFSTYELAKEHARNMGKGLISVTRKV